MKWKGLIVLCGVLAFASSATAIVPTKWDGNLYSEVKVPSFYRFGWVQWPDPVFPQITREYRNDLASWRFTANESGSIEALQLYTSTPGAKFGQSSPQLTISIQTDNGGEPSGTSIGSYTGTYPMDSVNQYTGAITAPMSATLTEGNVYHLVVKGDSLTTASQVQNGTDYANSMYDFRLTASNGAAGTPINRARTYDGTGDDTMMGLYYNRTQGGAYENQWVVGTPKETDINLDGHSDAQRRPLFEMFANYDPQTQTVSNPVPKLAEGYNDCYKEAGYNKGRPINDPSDAVGEKIMVYYERARPVALKVRFFLRKDKPNETFPEGDGDLLLEIKDSTNTVLATGTVPSSSIPFDGQYCWAEAELDTVVQLPGGPGGMWVMDDLGMGGSGGGDQPQTFYMTVRSPDITQGCYRVGVHQGTAELFPSTENSHYGTTSLLVESADGGTTWTETDTRDSSFGFAVIIPGDFNGDGCVNVGDLGILGVNYGQPPWKDWTQGDANGDGIVNVGDLGIIGMHWGECLTPGYYHPPEAGGPPVPEPTTLSVLVLGALALLRRRSR